jgi:hypothetical protein
MGQFYPKPPQAEHHHHYNDHQKKDDDYIVSKFYIDSGSHLHFDGNYLG